MTDEEAFRILGVEPGMDAKGVQGAYRRKALELHPDRAASTEQAESCYRRFLEVRDAYEHLRHGGFPTPTPLPEPEEVVPMEDVFPGDWARGRSFAPKEDPEDVALSQKLGLDMRLNPSSLLLWGLMVPGGAVLLVYFLKFLLNAMRGPDFPE